VKSGNVRKVLEAGKDGPHRNGEVLERPVVSSFRWRKSLCGVGP